MKAREGPGNIDHISRLEAAEAKLQELKSSMVTLGKEATAAMAAVEAQQQRLTLQRLIAMVSFSSSSFFFFMKLGSHAYVHVFDGSRLNQSAPTTRESCKFLISWKGR